MWVCYVIALIPVLVGAFLWLTSRRITFREWMIGSVIGFAVAVGFHAYGYLAGTVDLMIISGPVESAAHWPNYGGRTEEEDGWGEHWTITLDLGDGYADVEITEDEFDRIRSEFGATELESVAPRRHSVSDDDYVIHVAKNRTGAVVPGWTLRLTSRADVGSEVFSYTDPPGDAPLYEYPFDYDSAMVGAVAREFGQSVAETRSHLDEEDRHDWRHSSRLLGRANGDLDVAAWDALNARVFPETGANLIAIGFDGDSLLAQWQEAKWTGGKRNDLVLCYGQVGPDGKPGWTYCFGWAEDEIVKRQLESLLLIDGFGDGLPNGIERIVREHFRPKVFGDIGWFQIRPPQGAVGTLILVMIFVQGGYWFIAWSNWSRRGAADDTERKEEQDESIRRTLQQREKSHRKRLDEKLAHLGPDPSEERLREEVLGGKEPYFAIMELSTRDGLVAGAALVVGLTSDNFRAREWAEDTLNETIPDPATCEEGREAMADLIERLGHRNPTVRRESRRVLDLIDPSRREGDEAKRELRDLSQKLEGGAVAEALSGLADLGPGLRMTPGSEDLYELVHPRLGAADPTERANAILVLGWLGDERAVPDLVPFLADDVRAIRRAAITALGVFHTPAANRALLDALADAEKRDQTDIVTALKDCGDPAVVPPLIALYETAKEGGSLLPERIFDAIYPFGGSEVEKFLEECASEFFCPAQDTAAQRLENLREGLTKRPWSRPVPGA